MMNKKSNFIFFVICVVLLVISFFVKTSVLTKLALFFSSMVAYMGYRKTRK